MHKLAILIVLAFSIEGILGGGEGQLRSLARALKTKRERSSRLGSCDIRIQDTCSKSAKEIFNLANKGTCSKRACAFVPTLGLTENPYSFNAIYNPSAMSSSTKRILHSFSELRAEVCTMKNQPCSCRNERRCSCTEANKMCKQQYRVERNYFVVYSNGPSHQASPYSHPYPPQQPTHHQYPAVDPYQQQQFGHQPVNNFGNHNPASQEVPQVGHPVPQVGHPVPQVGHPVPQVGHPVPHVNNQQYQPAPFDPTHDSQSVHFGDEVPPLTGTDYPLPELDQAMHVAQMVHNEPMARSGEMTEEGDGEEGDPGKQTSAKRNFGYGGMIPSFTANMQQGYPIGPQQGGFQGGSSDPEMEKFKMLVQSLQQNNGGGFPQQGFPQGGFPQVGFPQGGFPQGGFSPPGFSQGGFPQQQSTYQMPFPPQGPMPFQGMPPALPQGQGYQPQTFLAPPPPPPPGNNRGQSQFQPIQDRSVFQQPHQNPSPSHQSHQYQTSQYHIPMAPNNPSQSWQGSSMLQSSVFKYYLTQNKGSATSSAFVKLLPYLMGSPQFESAIAFEPLFVMIPNGCSCERMESSQQQQQQSSFYGQSQNFWPSQQQPFGQNSNPLFQQSFGQSFGNQFPQQMPFDPFQSGGFGGLQGFNPYNTFPFGGQAPEEEKRERNRDRNRNRDDKSKN